MNQLHIDLETYSTVELKKAGLYKYVEAPSFEVLLCAYSLNGGPVLCADLAQGEQLPPDLVRHLFAPDTIKYAFNAAFEWCCLSKYFRLFTGRVEPIAWLAQWRCVQLHSLYCGYTISLETAGEAIGLPQDKRKQGIGLGLIRTFCTPCIPSKANGNRTRTLPRHEPERWNLFKEYNRQDVVAEMEIERRLSAFPVPEDEYNGWRLDQVINSRGVRIDTDLAAAALKVDYAVKNALTDEAIRITGVKNPKSVQQLATWLNKELPEDEPIADLKKDTVTELLGRELESDDACRVLEIRQELAKTSTTKYKAMELSVCTDARVRGLLQYYGANRTGRWAGRLVQTQNLPRNYLKALDLARVLVRQQRVEDIKLLFGSVTDTLSQLIRTAFIPAPGQVLLVADYSAIEARVIAWLAGEQWVLDVFNSHGKIYEAAASQMFGVPLELIKRGNPEYELRQKGKVATLALGYQGAVGALIKMGALNQGLTEEELPEIVHRWRQANKRITALWYAVEEASLECVRTGQPMAVKNLLFAREIDREAGQDFLTMRLPSGRKLYYARPFLLPSDRGKEALWYYNMDQTTKKWAETNTYGGKLVENAVQAIARDCLALALRKLEAAGYQIVMHVHDEVIIEAPDPNQLDAVCEIMGEPIHWAPGLPLRADGFTTYFYKKD